MIHYCTKGRECRVNDLGEAECICQRWCAHRKKPVCGNDGIIYENHCLLHRASCYQDKPLSLQRMELCLNRAIDTSSPASNDQIEIYRETTTQSSKILEFTTQNNPVSTIEPITVQSTDNNNDNDDNVVVEEITNYIIKKCSPQEYEIMKDNLLLYSHARLMSQDNNHSKDFLVSIMFSHYDQNNNGHLDADELHSISLFEHLEELSNGCALNDMIIYDDTDHDGQLSVNEFNQAFSKLYSKYIIVLKSQSI